MTVIDETTVKSNGGCHHVGRYAEGYRYAFKRGAVDALRVAARRLPRDMWDVLEQLCTEYENDDENDYAAVS